MADGYDVCNNEINFFNLCRFIGQTVTIFTTSGGLSGAGFTGILMNANECFVTLLTRVGAAPSCPVGSSCLPIATKPTGCYGGYCDTYGYGGGLGAGYGAGYGAGVGAGVGAGYGAGYGAGAGIAAGYGLGSVVVIPTDRIASFVHNAI